MKEKIKRFIIEHFLSGKGDLNYRDSLFEKDIVDSFGILELIAFIEKEFSVSINPSEITVENFNSINKIVELINKKEKDTK